MMPLTELCLKLNKQLTTEYKFKLNPIHSTFAKQKEGVNVEFLRYENSISKDPTIIPSHLIPKIILNNNAKKLLNWINLKLFTASLNQLLRNTHLKTSAEEVRLRIAVNMISKQNFLTKEEREEWVIRLQNVYYERKRVILNYYFQEIEQLPFLDYRYWVTCSPLIRLPMKQEIIELVEQAKQGSQKAFAELYYKYKQTIWFTVYNVVKNQDVADDLVSIVFTKAYEKLNSYTNYISFEMWLKTIAVNSAIDFIRRTKKERLNQYTDDEDCTIQLSETDKSPEEQLILTEKLALVNKYLPTLKKKYKDLIELRINGIPYKDIAEKLAISENTVKSMLNKARQILKQKISNV